MRIDQLEIHNFKGFSQRTFEFPRSPQSKRKGSFHLLVGENGSGKSSALDAAAVALGIWCVARPTAGWRAIHKGEARLEQKKHGRTVRFDPLPDPAIKAKGVIGDTEVSWTRMNKGTSQRTTNEEAKEALAVVQDLLKSTYTPNDRVTLPVLVHYGAGRAWLPQTERPKAFKTSSKKVSRFDAYFQSLEGRIRTAEVNEWFLFESIETFQRGGKREGMKAVEKAVLNCIPEAKSLRYDGDRKEIVLVMKPKQGGEIPFSCLSDGQRSMLSLVADLAIKTTLLNPHLGAKCASLSPGVVLIDELDLHLHPKWQRRVVDDLKRTFPNMQFICTTHSPFLIQSLEPGELIHLQTDSLPADYANQSLEDIVESVQGVTMPQRSRRAEEMSHAATEYFQALNKPGVTKAKVKQAEARYRQATEPFTDDPGLNALMKLKAVVALQKPAKK